jgi:hypothetical protein
MKLPSRLGALVALLAFGFTVVPDVAAAAMGSIKGVVKDGKGSPLVGAEVAILTDGDASAGATDFERLKSEKVIKRASTDGEGRFVASGIVPGRYKVKAEASGFTPVELAAFVKANKATVFDSILLRRIGTLEDQTSLNDDPKFASRTARGTIFHYNEDGSADSISTPDSQELALPSGGTKGFVYAFSQSASGYTGLAGSYVGTDFAISEQLSRSSSLVVTGQTGIGELSPQRLGAMTTTNAGDKHQVAVAVAYARFAVSRDGVESKLGQATLAATDTWQISAPIVILYGFEFDTFTEGTPSGSSLLPRLGIAVDATSRTKLFAALTPGASTNAQTETDMEPCRVIFPEQQPALIDGHYRPIADRSYRLQVGGEHTLSENSSIEMMAFFDTIYGHAVGLLALPIDAPPDTPAEFQAQTQSGQSRGMRAVYHRHLGKVLEASAGYAFGQGQYLDPRGITDPASLFTSGLFQIFSAKLDANFVRTGTKISTIMRIAPSRAVFAIDPFEGQMTTYDPNLSILVTQALPSLGLLPGQWTAVVDLRNLFNQQASVADPKQEILASQYHRLVRIGVSVRF